MITHATYTVQDIRTTLESMLITLEEIKDSPTYQAIEKSDSFNTSNDLVLADAYQALLEVTTAIDYLDEPHIF